MKKSEIDRIRSIEKSYRVKNKYFHHTLKQNIEIESTWGAVKYLVCTNKFGFRKNCNKKENLKNKKLILIGDSFTEGVGLNYKDTFAGMLDQSSKYEIINMGVTSYSPIIYFNKIKYYIDRGLKADHVIIFVDISDIDDEANYYTKCKNSDYVCDKKKINKINLNNEIERNKKIFPLSSKIKTGTKKLKRKIKPKNYLYRKDFVRSNWTYIKPNRNINEGIFNSIKHMDLLYKYLKSKNIPISVAVYPHPGQILHDKEDSLQVKIWQKFCVAKCKYFINLFPTFFEEKGKTNNMNIINKYYIERDIHLNKNGNEKIFKYLINFEFGAPGRI